MKHFIHYTKLILTALLLFSSVTLGAQRTADRIAYIQKYKDIAIRQMKQTGIPASIILAQACLESGDGKSNLAVKANNHFGIKCHDWTGPTYRKDDDKKNECFRKYRNVEDSFKDHSEFLTTRSRYAFLFSYSSDDYRAWAYGLKKAGYATNPQYAQLLINIIETYDLHKFDKGGEGAVYLRESGSIVPAKETKERIYITEHPLYRYNKEKNIYLNNGRAYIIGQNGDTYKDLAKTYRLFRKELLSFNDLKKDIPVNDGDIIYLERKKNRAAKEFRTHRYSEGDDLYSISQKYGIKLKKLRKRNNIPEGREPDAGTVLKLR